MSRLSRLLLAVAALALVLSGSPAWSAREEIQPPRVKRYTCGDPELDKIIDKYVYATADLDCEPKAWTAISRLPPVRLIVYDPLSNSFSFVSVCRNEGHNAKNLEYLDRRRLALPTQKIRLLILPYNPADGEIVIQTVDGNGIEFEETSGAAIPPAAQTGATTDKASEEESKDKEEKEENRKAEEEREKPVPSPNSRGTELFNRLKEAYEKLGASNKKMSEDLALTDSRLQSLRSDLNRTEDAGEKAEVLEREPPMGSAAPVYLLGSILDSLADYYEELEEFRKSLDSFRGDMDCIDGRIRDLPHRIGSALTERRFMTAAQDPPLCNVVAEALVRSKAIELNRYVSCTAANSDDFGVDSKALSQHQKTSSERLFKVDRLLRQIERSVERMAGATAQVERFPELAWEWRALVEDYRRDVEDAQEYHDLLRTSLREAVERSEALRESYRSFQEAQVERAVPIQRKNYNPLQNGKSITFNVQRRLPDSHLSDPIAQLELRSAPAYNLRFGMGVIASDLADPTFKAGPEQTEVIEKDGKKEEKKVKRILFDDEGNRQIFPVVAVHHYWGKRSPMLMPTWFERLMPTLTLGIPIAKTEILEQAIFGLNWDLAPGVDLNIGAHIGKVNSLAPGYRVGQFIDTNLDVTAIEQERYEEAFYFGILLNSELFSSLFNARN